MPPPDLDTAATPEARMLLREIRCFEADLVMIRRDIHAHPETAYEEVRTAGLVAAALQEWGVEVATGIGRTGVVGTVRGRLPGGGAIALRADMDALPIQEGTGLPYASRTAGKMHACGHDGHTAMLLGAARHLAAAPDFPGTVHFLFQPAEEGGAGAQAMLNDGLLDRFPCDAFFGMHNHAGMPPGRFGIRPGPMLAAADNWDAVFRGTGGGSAPHLCTDPTVPLAQFVLGLQTVIGRNVAATDAALINVSHVAAGRPDAPNVIPSEVLVRGTARSFAPQTRALIERRINELAASAAAAFGCTAETRYSSVYPAMVNDVVETLSCIAAAADLVGRAQVDDAFPQMMAAEDFAFLARQRPGAMIMIGNGIRADGGFARLHTPFFDFNDDILALGAAYWVNLVRRRLSAPAHVPGKTYERQGG